MHPFGSNVRSALTQADFPNVASLAMDAGQSTAQLLIAACARHANRPAFTNLERTLSYREVDPTVPFVTRGVISAQEAP